MDSVEDGLQETLTLYPNGAYKSATTIVDPEAQRAHLVRDCQWRSKRFRKVHCDQKAIDKEFAAIAKFYPEIFIGTYDVVGARIEFVHGCAEGVQGCKPGQSTDSALFFVEGATLTIKSDGVAYKGRIVGGGAITYSRQH